MLFFSVSIPRRLLTIVGIQCLLSACASTDPLTQQGHWLPTGANEANLRAQVANPNDLNYGQSDPYYDGTEAANAIERWRKDQVKPLPQSGVSDLKATGSSNQNGSSGQTATDTSASGAP